MKKMYTAAGCLGGAVSCHARNAHDEGSLETLGSRGYLKCRYRQKLQLHDNTGHSE